MRLANAWILIRAMAGARYGNGEILFKTSRLSGVLPHTKYVSTLHRILRELVVHRILKNPSGITRSGSFEL
jgi:hypothetical protein